MDDKTNTEKGRKPDYADKDLAVWLVEGENYAFYSVKDTSPNVEIQKFTMSADMAGCRLTPEQAWKLAAGNTLSEEDGITGISRAGKEYDVILIPHKIVPKEKKPDEFTLNVAYAFPVRDTREPDAPIYGYSINKVFVRSAIKQNGASILLSPEECLRLASFETPKDGMRVTPVTRSEFGDFTILPIREVSKKSANGQYDMKTLEVAIKDLNPKREQSYKEFIEKKKAQSATGEGQTATESESVDDEISWDDDEISQSQSGVKM